MRKSNIPDYRNVAYPFTYVTLNVTRGTLQPFMSSLSVVFSAEKLLPDTVEEFPAGILIVADSESDSLQLA